MPPKKDSKGPVKKRKNPIEWLKYTTTHSDFFGPGHHNPSLIKVMLLHIDEALKKRYPRRDKKTHEEEFVKLSGGFAYGCVRSYRSELSSNDGYLFEPDTRGRQYQKLADSDDFDFLFEFVMQKVEAAKKGSYLTLTLISEAIFAEKALKCSHRELSEALHTLGFRYKRRRAVYATKRGSERVQGWLRKHVDWVHKYTQRLPSGRFAFTIPICFQDESWLEEHAFRLESWVFGDDNTADLGGGLGARIALLDTIFSFKFVDTARESWNTGHKTGAYHGNCTSETICKYFGEDVFPELAAGSLMGGGAVALVDNASTHKSWQQSFKDFDDDDIFGWVLEHETNPKLKKLFCDTVQKEWDGLPKKKRISLMTAWCLEHNLRTRALEAVAELFHCKIRYIPPYHPECNPIEYVWCRLKRKFRDMPRDLGWKERLRRAYECITEEFIDACIDRSIRWCLAKRAFFIGAGRVFKPVAIPSLHVADPDSESDDSDSDACPV